MRSSRPSIVLLAIASGLSPFGMAIVLPAIPNVVERFGSDYAIVQFIVSAYLLGLAISQPLSGFLCDRFGRRPVMLIGFSAFVVASVGCAWAASLPQLIGMRFVQALGVSTGTVVSRAIIRDTYSADVGARAMSFITIGLGVAPVVAPMFGGWLDAAGGPRAIFLATAACGVIVLAGLVFRLAETRDASVAGPRWGDWFGSYARLLGSRPFLGYTLIYGFVQGSFFSFLAVGASVFEADFGMSAQTFGIVWGVMAVSYVVGALLGGRLSVSAVSEYLLPVGMLATLAFGWLLGLSIFLVGVHPLTLLAPMVALMMLSGAVTPIVMAGAVYHHPDIAGTSAGLSSALGLVIGSSFTIASGFLYSGDFLPVAVLIAGAATMTAASWLLVRGYASG